MIDVLKSLIKQFMPFAQERIGFEFPPKLFLKQDQENAQNPLGKTAYYDPQEQAVTLYVTGRHPKDVLRSLGHELVHHKQNCDGKFNDVGGGDMGEGYAQTNPHLRAMEFEANSKGSMCLRDFEDRLKMENTTYYEHLQKGEKQMSIKDWKNNELTQLLSEAWGFKFSTLQEFDEFSGTGEVQEEAQEEEIEEAALGSRLGGDRAKRQCEKQGKKMVAGKCVDPDTLEEAELSEEEEEIEEGGTAARPENAKKGEERRMKTSSAMREFMDKNASKYSEAQMREALKEAIKIIKERQTDG